MAPNIAKDTRPSWKWGSFAYHSADDPLSFVLGGIWVSCDFKLDRLNNSTKKKSLTFWNLADPRNHSCSTWQIIKRFGIHNLIRYAHDGTVKAGALRMLTDVCETRMDSGV